jgi:hypothetical protein
MRTQLLNYQSPLLLIPLCCLLNMQCATDCAVEKALHLVETFGGHQAGEKCVWNGLSSHHVASLTEDKRINNVKMKKGGGD